MQTVDYSPSQPAPEAVSRLAHSRFYQRLHRRYEAELALFPAGVPSRAGMEQALDALSRQGMDPGAALRVLRQLVMERLMQLDCAQQAPLAVVTQTVTWLAEVALDRACIQARRELDERHGAPTGPEGQPVPLWIVGMGKFGARELNVSSDIDLIYVYEHEGETTGQPDGRGRISNHEYFTRAVKIIYGLIGEVTEHGFVFRVDLALRPNGNSGPPAVSLAALEDYLQTQGREWERFAWLKSRVVAPREAVRAPEVQGLRAVILPFVFRRYLDYSVFDALRSLHRQIREHAAKRSAGHPGRANDVKLSRGGIREIEFTVQLLQVVRGGQFPELRCRPTLEALQRLSRAGLMSDETAAALAQAYTFLRQVEHRIQYLDDQQTHVLPTRDDDLLWIAQTMGYPDCSPFLHQLDAHRELVAEEFDTLLGGNAPRCSSGQCNGPRALTVASPQEVDDLIAQMPARMAARVAEWRDHPRLTSLRDETRARLFRLVQRTSQWVADGSVGEEAAVRLINWLEPLMRRESYLALLLERPAVHERLLHLLGAARWPARYLLQHPGVIDELAGDALLTDRFVAADFERELALRLASLQTTGEDDDETLLNLLRRAHHAEIFRTLARDVEGRISVEQVADDLSALADSVLRVTVQWCWERLKGRHREQPEFGIIGYGKLGGKELGYGSDLDIVFVFDDDDERAPEVYAALVRKLINWLTVKTGEGDLFEIDTALRPNGSSGLLVTSFDAYAKYQQQRGSNTAWTWEHQAMTRARFVLGSAMLRARFDAVREAVISAPRNSELLRAEIVAMRARLRAAHPARGELFDVKHSPGGMVDVEFAVQYLVLLCSGEHPQLMCNAGNIALLRHAEQCGLLPEGVGQAAADAYRALRRIQHNARLDEASGKIDALKAAPHRDAVLALWRAVFGVPGAVEPCPTPGLSAHI
ncbi:bifunctional [glutamate--ammonia ligase]-adenylyl-L-tyrosine phosphorylase/[glutamate--ammonia-ligase] adenylyltransferase [Comamonas endophytica]|uniref:Bifunctional glutamine synthetase adenylyltransferase/adenylyl-removing enzyme n=1 Tax=Comamonas endophytica TaxID=2949090 RepID=A0ABY6G749_9BURK|nr:MULTISPECIES: bifunctional [glutamate--ammonia ligase]-adenylyl-L-tyrosine phosphorylase/[glutamate--ammonia-ligase] adenylyltransferase [unclassified Acidovorax]MCD2512319.1 bifunctional [glutamate--ammonia ligase]-adenylyl-L-tyrosine phosphorylase/[glutamate--ammonia-ligase] adenylyltransferase [Acidovorax sp. D4N7]UYG50227.1 bifunctional [glutamate--ammonia ligase]-adenylyl-L-tyrosine phosphorylase/[glutamate--ammonia-ligase] adenylyltransferase [Acidovorax sp. 5MLIR]